MSLAVAAASLALATLALTLGQHALEWRLGTGEAATSRIASFDLATKAHLAASLSVILFVALDLPGAGPATILAWVAIALFSGALYLHALTGRSWAMPAAIPGGLALPAAWGTIALSSAGPE